MTVTRRSAVTLLSSVCSFLAVPSIVKASIDTIDTRRLHFRHRHTDEELDAVYHTASGYDHGALNEINHILRDWRSDAVKTIDPAVLDYVFEVQMRLGHRDVVEILSGYRTKKTNDMLRARNRGVAKYSLHIEGRAIDISLPGIRTVDVRDTALSLKRGGVGTYRRSGFVHLDTGEFRRWGG